MKIDASKYSYMKHILGTTKIETISESSPKMIYNTKEFLFFHIQVRLKEIKNKILAYVFWTQNTLVV